MMRVYGPILNRYLIIDGQTIIFISISANLFLKVDNQF